MLIPTWHPVNYGLGTFPHNNHSIVCRFGYDSEMSLYKYVYSGARTIVYMEQVASFIASLARDERSYLKLTITFPSTILLYIKQKPQQIETVQSRIIVIYITAPSVVKPYTSISYLRDASTMELPPCINDPPPATPLNGSIVINIHQFPPCEGLLYI